MLIDFCITQPESPPQAARGCPSRTPRPAGLQNAADRGSNLRKNRTPQCFGFRISVSGFGLRVSGFGFRASGFGSRISSLGFWVSGFESRILGGNQEQLLRDVGVRGRHVQRRPYSIYTAYCVLFTIKQGSLYTYVVRICDKRTALSRPLSRFISVK